MTEINRREFLKTAAIATVVGANPVGMAEAATVAPHGLRDGLVGYWMLDESSADPIPMPGRVLSWSEMAELYEAGKGFKFPFDAKG
jgi:hypothetical protein